MGGFKLGKMTMRSLFGRPETRLYPTETRPAPAGLRGRVELDAGACILCGICARKCPAGAIAVDKTARTWSIDRFGCVQCTSCVRECPKGCLSIGPAYTAPATARRADTCAVPEKAARS